MLGCRGTETVCVLSGLAAGSSYLVQVLAYEAGELVHRSAVTPMLTAPTPPGQPDPPRLVEVPATLSRTPTRARTLTLTRTRTRTLTLTLTPTPT